MVIKKNKNKVFVAMSGGVDSSVSAALLKKAGFDVIGVYMKQWAPEILGKECIWKTDRQDAMRVAAKLNIPFFTWDFSKEYQKQVGKYMIDAYKKGITPNPDVMCNKIIKFGLFFDRAIKEGADFIATGHYAKINKGKLLKSQDKNKDQTYFLYEISKKQLSKILFPVGNLEKSEVRILAKKFGLENSEKKDSQGVCFVGQFKMKEFLKMYIKPKKGKILLIKKRKARALNKLSARPSTKIFSAQVLGQHDGVYYYTIGQRHGLDIKDGGGPYFVVSKDLKKNIIYVGKEKDLLENKAKVVNINWISQPKKFPASLDVRVRYRAPLVKASLQKNGNLTFKKHEKAITSGQSAVFYKGSELIGGGIIK